jgi:hypothetical protein
VFKCWIDNKDNPLIYNNDLNIRLFIRLFLVVIDSQSKKSEKQCQTQFTRYSQPVLIIFGTIGAILNQILFFYRKPLKISSCSLCFRALSANDLLVVYTVGLQVNSILIHHDNIISIVKEKHISPIVCILYHHILLFWLVWIVYVQVQQIFDYEKLLQFVLHHILFQA